MTALTDSQRTVFVALLDMMMEAGRNPTLRELCARTGIGSTNGVSEHLVRFRNRGLLEHDALKSRALSITDRGWEYWATILSERFGRVVSPAEAELMTLTWRTLHRRDSLEVTEGLLALMRHVVRHSDIHPEPATTSGGH